MLRIFFTFLLVICLVASARALVSTKVDGVKLRSGPGPNYTQKIDFPKYYPLRVLGKSGKWYKVADWMGMRGWVNASQISNVKTAVVRKIKVNLRSGPSTRYRKITTLYQGYILKVLQKRGYWYKILVVDPPEQWKGWVHRRLVWG